MVDSKNASNNLRFFSNSSLFKNPQCNETKQQDPTPFGLGFQEPIANDHQLPRNAGITMGPSPTNTPTGSDTCFDVDYDF